MRQRPRGKEKSERKSMYGREEEKGGGGGGGENDVCISSYIIVR